MKITEYSPITSWQIYEETMETVTDFILGSYRITSDGDCSHEIKTRLLLGRKAVANLDSILKSRDIMLPTKVRLAKVTVVESPLDCKEIKPVNYKGNQSWIFIGRTDAEAETSILWPLDAKNWLIGQDPDAGKDWRREEKGTTENEMVGWHHWLNGHEFEQALGAGDGQGSLACCSSWGRRVGHDWATELNW